MALAVQRVYTFDFVHLGHHRSLLVRRFVRFVDLATMAKISVLILDEKFHGWYLHCRSPYPRVRNTFITSAPSSLYWSIC